MDRGYYSDWSEVLLFIGGGLLFVAVTLFAARLLRPHRPNEQKNAPYESGENAVGSPWIQFNARFYVLALIFLLFEVELVFLFPWSVIFANPELIQQTNGAWGWFMMVEVAVFVGLLAIGLAYAWVNGHLNWLSPKQKQEEFKSPVPPHLYDQLNERYKS